MALVQFCDYRGKTKADMKSHSRVHFREVEKKNRKKKGEKLRDQKKFIIGVSRLSRAWLPFHLSSFPHIGSPPGVTTR